MFSNCPHLPDVNFRKPYFSKVLMKKEVLLIVFKMFVLGIFQECDYCNCNFRRRKKIKNKPDKIRVVLKKPLLAYYHPRCIYQRYFQIFCFIQNLRKYFLHYFFPQERCNKHEWKKVDFFVIQERKKFELQRKGHEKIFFIVRWLIREEKKIFFSGCCVCFFYQLLIFFFMQVR